MSLLGLTLTFSGLGLLVLIIMALERIFRQRPLVPDEPSPADKPQADTLTRDSTEEECVAAIAVALTHLLQMERSQGRLGAALEAGRGPWWRARPPSPIQPVRRR